MTKTAPGNTPAPAPEAAAAQGTPPAPNQPPSLTGASLADSLSKLFAEPPKPTTPPPPPPAPETPPPGEATPAEAPQGTPTQGEARQGHARPGKTTPTPPAEASQADWPATAVDVVTGLRAERRELRADLDATRQMVADLQKAVKAAKGTPEETAQPTLSNQEQEQMGLARWAKSTARLLARDPEKAKEQLTAANIRLPDDSPEAIHAWLEDVQDRAETSARDLAVKRAVEEATRGQAVQTGEQQLAAQAARHVVPELADEQSPRAQKFGEILRNHPELTKHPRGQLIAAAILLGTEQILPKLEALQNRNGNGNGNGHLNGNGNGHPPTPKPTPPENRLPRPRPAPRPGGQHWQPGANLQRPLA
jgi:hypothetical protein